VLAHDCGQEASPERLHHHARVLHNPTTLVLNIGLVLYLTRALEYDEATAIALFAYMTCLAYLSPIVGALLADGRLGRYTTILWFGCIYAIGLVILTVGAFMDSSDLDTKRLLTFLGLFLGSNVVGIDPLSQDTNGNTPVNDAESRVRAFFASF
jgi:hypothetical protein